MIRLVLVSLLIAVPAWADIIDPEVEGCSGAEAGSVCALEDGSSGTCQPGECCRLDYSTDADTPGQVCEDCLRCTAAMAATGGQMAGGSAATGGQPASAGAPGAGAMGGGGEPTTTNDEDESGCSAGLSSEGSAGFVAAFFGFLLALRLRRSR